MSEFGEKVRNLIKTGEARISEHGYDELAEDGLTARDLFAAVCGGDSEDKKTKKTKYVHEGRYVAEVDVELIEGESERSPYLSLDDAYKLDDGRNALCQSDLALASRHGRIYNGGVHDDQVDTLVLIPSSSGLGF